MAEPLAKYTVLFAVSARAVGRALVALVRVLGLGRKHVQQGRNTKDGYDT